MRIPRKILALSRETLLALVSSAGPYPPVSTTQPATTSCYPCTSSERA